jgi:hypothetical protein
MIQTMGQSCRGIGGLSIGLVVGGHELHRGRFAAKDGLVSS